MGENTTLRPVPALLASSDLDHHVPLLEVDDSGTDARAARPGEGLVVLIPTCGRRALLDRLLTSLYGERQALDEVVVGCHAEGCEGLLERHRATLPMLRVVVAAGGGKSAVLNALLRATRGRRLAFLDDDVEVLPGWGAALLGQFDARNSRVFQGRILLPAVVQADPTRLRHERAFGLHPWVDMGTEVCERGRLTGANFALERETLERVGGLDEALGPGAAGLSEDTDLGRRLRRAGDRILYVPGAAVRHAWFPERATAVYHAEYHVRLGRSRWLMKGRPSWSRVLPEFLYASLLEALTHLLPEPRLRLHRRGKRIHYQTMLRCAWHARRTPGAT